MRRDVTSDLLGESGAIFTDDDLYRIRLWRSWGDGPRLGWLMLNPSTADGLKDDPTIRRCIGFAKREGLDGIEVLNLYQFRATSPKGLTHSSDPFGPDAVQVWRGALGHVRKLVAGWGSSMPILWTHRSRRTYDHGAHAAEMLTRLTTFDLEMSGVEVVCLGKTSNGSPRHPLYVKGDTPFEPYP